MNLCGWDIWLCHFLSNLSIRMTSHPARRAPRAAAIPLGPPPTTSTWHLAKIGIARGLSGSRKSRSFYFICDLTFLRAYGLFELSWLLTRPKIKPGFAWTGFKTSEELNRCQLYSWCYWKSLKKMMIKINYFRNGG